MIAGLIHAICVSVLSQLSMTSFPNTGDEFALIFQSEIFSHFSLTAEAPLFPELFQSHYIDSKLGRWFSQYPPVYPLMILPGVVIGWPHLMVSLFAGLTLFSLCLFLLRAFGEEYRREIIIFSVFFAVSPTFLWHGASYYNHIGSLFLYSLILHCFLNHRESNRNSNLGWLSLLFGLGVGIRPFTFFLLALPFGFFLSRDKTIRNPRSILSLSMPFLSVLFLLGLYNYHLTGRWEEISYLQAGNNYLKLSLSNFHFDSIVRISEMIENASRWLFGFGYFAGGSLRTIENGDINFGIILFLISIFWLTYRALKNKETIVILLVLSIFSLVCGHIFYDFRGGRFGERFFYEISWIILFGLVIFLKEIKKYGLVFMGLIVLVNLIYLPGTYQAYVDGNMRRMDPFLKVKSLKDDKVVIHLHQVPDFDPSFYTRNHPDLSGPVYVILSKDFNQVIKSFKDRKHYLYSFDRKSNNSQLLPISEKQNH